MDRKIYLMAFLLAIVMANAQTYEQTNFKLNEVLPGNKDIVYEATTSIRLLDGFYSDPDMNRSVMMKINRFGVFPPEDGYLGGHSGTYQEGVVGALPGNLNISDFGGVIYSIPIMMPHGIGAMTPHIAVTYNNQAGNGLLGWGWSLTGLSSIVRVGQTMYHDNNETVVNFVDDRFAVDGKRLMLCSGIYGENGALYKTEIDEMSKIISFSAGYNGPSRFIIYKKDGTIWEYGGTNDSRIEPKNRNDVVLTWLVNKITDRDGNSIVFHYVENQNEGEWYINNIEYTVNESAGISSMYKVDFVYRDRSDVERGYVFENIVQSKKILVNIVINNMMTGSTLYDYSFNYLEPGNYDSANFFMYYRLHSIGLTANGMKLGPTIISWNNMKKHYPENYESYLLSKDMFNKVPFVGDFNGDGYSDVALVPYKIGTSYQNDVVVRLYLNKGDGTFDDNPFFSVTLDKTLEWLYIVDLDGDGLDDLIPYFVNDENNPSWKSKINAYLNIGKTFRFVGENISSRNYIIYPGDFCHERKTSFFVEYIPDATGTTNYPAIIYYSDNVLNSQSLGLQAIVGNVDRVSVLDIDSDGCSEIMLLRSDNAMIARITNEGGQYVFNGLYTDNNFNGDTFVFPGDFNGDGFTDVLKYDNVTYWKVAFSDGNRLQTPVPCMNNSLLNGLTLAPQDYYYCSLQNLSMPSVTIRTADFDGDGKTDVAVFKNTGGNYYVTMGFKMFKNDNNSYGFGDVRRYYMNINYSHQYVHVGNFLGRENASILSSVRSNPYMYEIPKIVSLNPQSAKYSVERVTDGLGNYRGFKYAYLMRNNSAQSYEYNYRWINDDVRTASLPVRALCADTVYSSNGSPCVTKYFYKNMLFHDKGRGFLGFEHTETKYFINNVLQISESVDNDMDLLENNIILLPKTRLKYNYNNQLVESEQYAYNMYKCFSNAKIIMPVLTCTNTVNYDFDQAGSIKSTKVKNNDYQSDMSQDHYMDIVNVMSTIDGYDVLYNGNNAQSCSYWEKTDYMYNNSIKEWAVARPYTIVKTQHYLDNDDVGSCEVYEYSNSNSFQVLRKVLLPNADMNYNDPLKIDAVYSYDIVGHAVTKSLTTPSSKTQKVTQVDYSAEYNYLFPTTSVNENGWEIHNTYDNNYGLLNSTMDYNQFETEYESDPFEITVENTLPGGVKNIKTKRWARDNEYAPNNAMFYCWEKTTGKAETLTFFNKKGKKLREVAFGLHGEPIYVDFAYDDRENLVSQSNPYKPGDDVNYSYYVYDNNNRLVEEVLPNGLTKTYSYNQLQNTICTMAPDGVTHTVVETMNPMGWRTRVVDIGGNIINYEYYSDGKLRSAMIGNNNDTKVEYEYDNKRNISKMKDPACGTVLYDYDAFGELRRATSPKQCVTTYEYDMLGNVVSRSETDAKGANTVVTQWIYDDKKGQMGMLSQIHYGKSHMVAYDYDDMLRITRVREIIDGVGFSTDYSYDDANREEIISYPSGLTVQKKYSNSGLYMSMVDVSDDNELWRTKSADARGYITDYQYGNGFETRLDYDKTSNLLNGIYTFSGKNVIQDLKYTYDAFGNLVNRTKSNGNTKSESFVYDEFNRLVEIRMNNAVTGSMEYDNYGNILSKYADKKSVFYDGHYYADCPYAIQKAKSNNKNLIGVNQTIEYTTFDKMQHVQSGRNSLLLDYGFDHERIRSESDLDGVNKTKVYVGDCEYVGTNGQNVIYTYLKGPMGIFAVCRTDDKGTNAIMYISKDHQSSWCLVTDENGEVLQNVSYDAWGNPRNGDKWMGQYDGELLCDRGFTGHEHLKEFGIINMNGRAYDPLMSMMMSPDSKIQNLDFSQNYNRYIYCYNNPLSYCDPSGEWIEWLLYGMFNGVFNVISNIENINSFEEGALAFGAGFISGCLTMGLSNCSWALQVAGNVVGSTLKMSVNNLVERNTGAGIDWSILDDQDFQTELKYDLGSCLATAVLDSYIVKPTDSEDGMTLAGKLCHNRVDQMVLETTASKVVGNLFSGKKVFEGLSCRNLTEFMPYARCVAGMIFDGLEFEGRASTLSSVFSKLQNIDIQGGLSNVGNGMNICYSSIRSLFLKN